MRTECCGIEPTFKVERLTDILEEIKDLLPLHWEESMPQNYPIALDPDYTAYLTLAAMDVLGVATVRDCGKLIGYCLSFLVPHLHSRMCRTALVDVLYLAREHRRGWTAYKLLMVAEQDLAKRGAGRVIVHVSIRKDFSRLLLRLGYKQIDHGYEKLLTREESEPCR